MSAPMIHQPKCVRNHDRDAYVAAMRQAGHTLQEIGDALGISRERVRQLCNRVGVSRVGNAAGEQHRLDPVAVVRFARSAEARSFTDVARAFDSDVPQVSKLLHALGLHVALKRLYRLRVRAAMQRRIVTQLRAFVAREGRNPTSWELTNGHRPDLPTQMTATRLFGSLEAAYAAAGLRYDRRRSGSPGHKQPRKGTFASGACRNGHPWTPESTYTWMYRGKEYHLCRICRKEREAWRRS